MGVSIIKQGVVKTTGEDFTDNSNNTTNHGFVESDSDQITKIYGNYIQSTEFIEW